MKVDKVKDVGIFLILLTILSLSLYIIEQVIFFLITRTDFSDHMASMVAMIALTTFILIYCKKTGYNLSIFPSKFTAIYIFASIISLCLLVATPSNYTGEVKPIALLIY